VSGLVFWLEQLEAAVVNTNTLQELYILSNAIVGIALLSVAAAISMFLMRKQIRFTSIYMMFALFYAMAGCGRLYKAFLPYHVPTGTELLLDGLAGIAAIGTALYVWPVTFKLLRLPSFEIKSLYESIVENSSDAIYTVSVEGIVLTWNRGAEKMFGYSAQEIIGNPVMYIIPDAYKDEVDKHLASIRQNIPLTDYETKRITKSGKLLDVAITASPILSDDGTISGASAIVRNITNRRLIEKEVQELNRELKKNLIELAKTNKELEVARDQALEASRLKSTFVANISHELRTPLSGILGMNELLLSTELDEEQRLMSMTVKESGDALLAVVNDILDLSKIEADKIVLEQRPFNPRQVVDECTKLLAPTAQTKGLGLKTEVDAAVPGALVGDAPRIKQILINLVGNALKFTEQGGVTVQLRLDGIDDDRALLYFAVKDTGIGIAEEDRHVLFAPFQQVDNSSTRRFGGTGLGLTISKKFIEMMGGEIGLESDKGRGSTFWFRLPLKRDQQNLRSVA
jgi:PAS domain S-box-containing protein